MNVNRILQKKLTNQKSITYHLTSKELLQISIISIFYLRSPTFFLYLFFLNKLYIKADLWNLSEKYSSSCEIMEIPMLNYLPVFLEETGAFFTSALLVPPRLEPGCLLEVALWCAPGPVNRHRDENIMQSHTNINSTYSDGCARQIWVRTLSVTRLYSEPKIYYLIMKSIYDCYHRNDMSEGRSCSSSW